MNRVLNIITMIIHISNGIHASRYIHVHVQMMFPVVRLTPPAPNYEDKPHPTACFAIGQSTGDWIDSCDCTIDARTLSLLKYTYITGGILFKMPVGSSR